MDLKYAMFRIKILAGAACVKPVCGHCSARDQGLRLTLRFVQDVGCRHNGSLKSTKHKFQSLCPPPTNTPPERVNT